MTLPTRPLGTSGIDITTVGFGAWAIGGGGWAFGWGPQDDADSLAAMRHALDLGINWIDTAAVYGLGHSEEVVGRLLRQVGPAERPLVFTKCGLVWDDRDRMAEANRILRPESIRKECEASLRRLGVERIDLYQFHWPDEVGGARQGGLAAPQRGVSGAEAQPQPGAPRRAAADRPASRRYGFGGGHCVGTRVAGGDGSDRRCANAGAG